MARKRTFRKNETVVLFIDGDLEPAIVVRKTTRYVLLTRDGRYIERAEVLLHPLDERERGRAFWKNFRKHQKEGKKLRDKKSDKSHILY